MFWDDIVLVTEQIEKFGLRSPFIEIGGAERPCIADYSLTVRTGDQQARFVTLDQRPFDHIDPRYQIAAGDQSFACFEELLLRYENAIRCAVCLELLESHPNPFHALTQLYLSMKDGSLVIISAAFSYPYRPDA